MNFGVIERSQSRNVKSTNLFAMLHKLKQQLFIKRVVVEHHCTHIIANSVVNFSFQVDFIFLLFQCH